MKINENDKQEYIKYFKETEGNNFDQVISLQIQTVVREIARLVGLLEGGYQIARMDSSEYRLIRESGASFLNELVRIARKLNVQLQ